VHALDPASPAIDHGDPGGCAQTDQRSFLRPVDGDSDGSTICDIGAFELFEKGLLAFKPFGGTPENPIYYTEADEPYGGSSQVTFTVIRLSGTTYAEVDYAASSSTDIVPANGTLRFFPGDGEETFDITILDDAWKEPDETIPLRLFNLKYSVGVLLTQGLADLTILANDPNGLEQPTIYLPIIRR